MILRSASVVRALVETGQLEVATEPSPGGVRIVVAGELDVSNVAQLRSTLEEHQGSGRRVLLDMSRLEFMDSTGLHLFLNAQADSRRDGWTLTFASQVTPAVERLLDLTTTRPLLDWAADS